MFYDCYNFNSNLNNWDVSSATNMYNMFNNCHNFNSNLSLWDVSSVTDMEFMIYGCYKFTGNGLEKWNVNPNTKINSIFNGCFYVKQTFDWEKYKK